MHFLNSSYLALTLFFSNAQFGDAKPCTGCCCNANSVNTCCTSFANSCLNGGSNSCCNTFDCNGGSNFSVQGLFPNAAQGLRLKGFKKTNKSNKSKKAKKAKAGKDKSVGNKRLLSRSDVEYDCGKQLYTLSFVGIGQHLMAVAKVKCAGPSKNCEICPSVLAFHQGSYQDNDNSFHVEKEMFEGSQDELANYDSLDVGVFTLENIFGAFEKAKSNNTVYDLVTHNCASLIIEMFLGLGIDPTDKSIVTYAANHLFDNANSFMMDGLSQNDFRLALEDNANVQADQYAIIEDFVKNYIDERV